jgi:DNA-binding NarL/FixJ family response regulator
LLIANSLNPPWLDRRTISNKSGRFRQDFNELTADDAITTRELDVLRGVANGSYKVIASNLNISEHTVKNHLRSILSKPDANDRTHAATIAMKRGILELQGKQTVPVRPFAR